MSHSEGIKPIRLPAGDERILLCGKPVKVDCYVVAASNYDLMIAQLKHAIQCNMIGGNQKCTDMLKQILKDRGESYGN